MFDTIIVAAPLVYVAIGALVVSGAFLITPRGDRPDFSDFVSVLLICMICWPVLVWAFFHSGDE
jgi:hypothetical protein